MGKRKNKTGKINNSTPAYNGNRPYIFISYAHKDTAKVIELIDALQTLGYRIWYDEGIEGGSEWATNIAKHLRNCTIFIAFISSHSMASENCLDEIQYAKSNNKQSLMIFLNEDVKRPFGVEMQTDRFQRLNYTDSEKMSEFIEQLQNLNMLAPCQGEDAIEYYQAMRKSGNALNRAFEKVESGKHKILDHIDRFMITYDNEELFCQAQLLYGKWLFDKDGTATLSDVDQAIDLCRQSAMMGNPKALAMLAYFYDKDYVILDDKNELAHLQIAYDYYSRVCYATVSEIEVQPGLPEVSWLDIREKTARSMLRMLSFAPLELQENPLYHFQANFDRVQIELGLTMANSNN